MQKPFGAQLLLNYYDPSSKGFKYRPIPQGNPVYAKLKELGCPTKEASYCSTDREGDMIIVPVDSFNYEHSKINGLSITTMIDLDSDLKMLKANSHDSASNSPRHSQIIDSTSPYLSATDSNPPDSGSSGSQWGLWL